tara:strand:+ start:887 stop:1558 length:672 start_codon:yes stop_codon:yes gene_type:complete
MHQRKSKNILIYFFLLFLFGSITNIGLYNSKFLNLSKIEISGLDENESKQLKNKIQNLKLKNIFFLNKNKIKNIIELNTLIENYQIFKIYPSNLYIKINKTKLLAKINQSGKIMLLGSNGKLSETISTNQQLPFIFGKPKVEEFLNFKIIIDQSKISYDEIENFYFFPSKRWDIELKNKIILKLPNEDIKNTLDYLFEFLDNKNLYNSRIIDARINNQIILND